MIMVVLNLNCGAGGGGGGISMAPVTFHPVVLRGKMLLFVTYSAGIYLHTFSHTKKKA